jgi:putative membrane protein
MWVKRNIPFSIIFRFAWKNILICFSYSLLLVLVHMYFHNRGYLVLIPFAPVSLIGIAVSFSLGFKNNQAYDRFWEARTIWGSIVNGSRHWANQVLNFIPTSDCNLSEEELNVIKKRLVYRHLAFINALRLNLRKPTSFSISHKGSIGEFHYGSPEIQHWEDEVMSFIDDDEELDLCKVQNIPTHILKNQGKDISELYKSKVIDDFRHVDMMTTLKDFYADQGKCERIKNTPFPRQYAYFSKLFVWIFIAVLPLALTTEFEKIGNGYIWMVVPFSTLISWIGDNSEDPFENFINDVPMTALCRNIEIDLKEMLGESDIPPRLIPQDGILM